MFVGEGAHEPVTVDGKGGVTEAKHGEDGQEFRVDRSVLKVDQVGVDGFPLPFVLELQQESTKPGGHEEDGNNQEAKHGSLWSFPWKSVEQMANDERTDDLCNPKDDRIETPCPDIKVGSVEVVELVGVGKVGEEEGGDEEEHTPVAKDGQDRLKLCSDTSKLCDDHGLSVVTDDGRGFGEEESETGRDTHHGHVDDVGRGGDVVEVSAKGVVHDEGESRAQDGADVEDCPETGDVLSLVVFGGIGHHHGALGDPDTAGAEAEEDTCKGRVDRMFVVPGEVHGSGVEEKGKSTKGGTGAWPEHVVGSTGDEEADDIGYGGGGDGEVLGGGRVVSCVADRGHCIEHTYGAQANDADQDDLAHGSGDHGEKVVFGKVGLSWVCGGGEEKTICRFCCF